MKQKKIKVFWNYYYERKNLKKWLFLILLIATYLHYITYVCTFKVDGRKVTVVRRALRLKALGTKAS